MAFTYCSCLVQLGSRIWFRNTVSPMTWCGGWPIIKDVNGALQHKDLLVRSQFIIAYERKTQFDADVHRVYPSV